MAKVKGEEHLKLSAQVGVIYMCMNVLDVNVRVCGC